MTHLNIDDKTLESLKRRTSPQADGGMPSGAAQLRIGYERKPNNMCPIPRQPCWLVNDVHGYLTASTSLNVVGELVKAEAKEFGSVRRALTGAHRVGQDMGWLAWSDIRTKLAPLCDLLVASAHLSEEERFKAFNRATILAAQLQRAARQVHVPHPL